MYCRLGRAFSFYAVILTSKGTYRYLTAAFVTALFSAVLYVHFEVLLCAVGHSHLKKLKAMRPLR